MIDSDGNCQPADLVVYLPKGEVGDTIVRGIKTDMPGIDHRTFEADVPKTKVQQSRRSIHEASLVSFAKGMKVGRKSASDIKKILGISPSTWERLVVKLKDRSTELSTKLGEAGGYYAAERQSSRTIGYSIGPPGVRS